MIMIVTMVMMMIMIMMMIMMMMMMITITMVLKRGNASFTCTKHCLVCKRLTTLLTTNSLVTPFELFFRQILNRNRTARFYFVFL